MDKHEGKIWDKTLGALLGVAVGDALGAPLEFMDAGKIQQKHGTVRDMIGGGWLDVAPGEVIDDTQMTLAVAEGIAESPHDPIPAIGRRFVEWADSRPKDIGNCCRAVIAYAKRSGAKDAAGWHGSAKRVHEDTGGQTAGNGALMRAAYPALYYGGDGLDVAVAIGRMTHWHEDSTLAVAAYTLAVADAVGSRSSLEEAKGQMELRIAPIRLIADEACLRPDGYAINSLICAANAVRDTNSFEDALIKAVNLGGDADTIGAIAGGLAGALYGAGQIPKRWTDALDKKVLSRIHWLAENAAFRESARR